MTNDDPNAPDGDGRDADRPAAEHHRGSHPAEDPAVDPDAPGTSALGLTDGDAVEPNEPG
jgi:hypothetical protein